MHTETGRHRNGQQLSNRMDGSDVEPGDGLRQSEPRMRALLRGANCNAAASDAGARRAQFGACLTADIPYPDSY